MDTKKLRFALILFLITALSQFSSAQGLNWEGQTGGLLTPFAYTARSPEGKLGRPVVAFHYLNAGFVIGNVYQISVTEGFGQRFEAGFTQSLSSSGNIGLTGRGNYPPSALFGGGFTTLHGKLTVVPENAAKTKWVPAIAVGALGRFGDQHVSWIAAGDTTAPTEANGDFYVVATKTITQTKIPIILNFGEKVTNASLMGIAGGAGNASNNDKRWQGRLFGTVGFVFKAPAKSILILAVEAAQQPRYIQSLGNAATIPTSLSYAICVIPHGLPVRIDTGILQVASKVNPNMDVNARARVGFAITYNF